jgi:signal transduction histidine kinase/ActR/RegA family two-component response regulator
MDSTIAIPVTPSGPETDGHEPPASATVRGERRQRSVRRVRRWGRLGWLSVLVLVCLAGLAIATSLVIRSVVRDQQRRLLHERAGEVGDAVTTAISGLEPALGMLSRIAQLSHYAPHQFATAASPLVSPGVEMLGIALPQGASFKAVTSVGPLSGHGLNAQQLALLRRAATSNGLVSGVVSTARGSQLDIALRGAAGSLVFESSAIDRRQPAASAPNSPYSELSVMLYAGPRAEPSQLVLTTTAQRALPGPVDHRLVQVGADRWLLLTASRRPLVGSLASDMPWIVLIAGLIGALLAAALVELLSRRRRYALGLVEARTTELRAALERQHVLELEHREARETAEKASRAKSEFLSRMSHELRTPLNAILGFGQLLELDDLTERQRENVKYILKGGGHLLELINEVLELARIEAGQLALSPEPVALTETVNETIALIQPLARAQGISLNTELGCLGAEVHVHADRQRLKQILLNLLSNAIKYNRPHGRVEVSAANVAPGRLRISVADTGIGIDPDHLARVFEPFDRLGAESGEVEGTGLGLALSKRLIEAMGGSIAFDSEPGAGSTFSLDLALADPPGLGENRPHVVDEDLVDTPAGERRLVLYIEDNLSNVTLVERILELQPGLELLPAMQGRLGLDLAREHRPALIMLDLHLPDMGGDEVLRRLRSEPETSEIPVVVLSADASKRQIQRLLDLGASDYLTKPLAVQRFREVVEAHLGVLRAA